MPATSGTLEVSAGFWTEQGARPRNEDFGGTLLGTVGQRARYGVVAAVADGVGGAKGGRVAAEATVRCFLDGYLGQLETRGVRDAAGRVLDAVNGWIFAQGRMDPALDGMACTFTALVLRGRRLHCIHVGDSRLYRLRDGRLTRLTTDHTLKHPDLTHVLHRAIGVEATVRVDYAVHAPRAHDRYVLCTDGVHGALPDWAFLEIALQSPGPEQAARLLVETALARGSRDNATALVLDVLALPASDHAELETAMAALPIPDPPARGDEVDGFWLGPILSDGRYSRLFKAEDTIEQRTVALKFPKPRGGAEAALRASLVRESWIGTHVHSPWLGATIELRPERQRRLYVTMPFHEGETLEHRLLRKPRLGPAEGIDIALKLAKAVAALHRAGIVHRDIKPDNVILTASGPRLVDHGIALLPRLGPASDIEIPGTPSYMAPEMFEGERGDERTDLFALGVTIYRMFAAGAYPYGEIEPFSRPRFGRPAPLLRHRPDLPGWLDMILARAVAPLPRERFADVMEFASDLETALVRAPAPAAPLRRPLYERNPAAVWQVACLVLLVLLLASLFTRPGPGPASDRQGVERRQEPGPPGRSGTGAAGRLSSDGRQP